MKNVFPHSSSFRDSSGNVIIKNNRILRAVNKNFKKNYDLLMNSGLYAELVDKGYLIPHREIKSKHISFYKIIKPDLIPVVSYPYEWSIDMLHAAARLTLTIEKIALKYNLTLKDASAFNIQFIGVKPVFIDTLSFTELIPGFPWIAYRQYCQHFIAPLSLMKYKDLHLGKLSQIFLDGLGLDLTVKLLPLSCYLNFHLFLNIFVHQKSQQVFKAKTEVSTGKKFSAKNFANLIDSLLSALENLKIKNSQSNWSDYYRDNNYSRVAFDNKIKIVSSILKSLRPGLLLDLGANTGLFTRIASKFADYSVSFDSDPQSVNLNFKLTQKEKIGNHLPLNIDLVNPSPPIGWQNRERSGILERVKADCVMSLALVHHLYFGNNLTFDRIALFFKSLSKDLIIEFVPPDDSQITKLIGLRDGDFRLYNENNFISAFRNYFIIKKRINIQNSGRIIFHMQQK